MRFEPEKMSNRAIDGCENKLVLGIQTRSDEDTKKCRWNSSSSLRVFVFEFSQWPKFLDMRSAFPNPHSPR